MLYYTALMRQLWACTPCFKRDTEKFEYVPAGATAMVQGQEIWLGMKEAISSYFIQGKKKKSSSKYLLVFPWRDCDSKGLFNLSDKDTKKTWWLGWNLKLGKI